jgi:hypothetical protein
MPAATDAACRLFSRRASETTTAMRSPNTPRTLAPGTKPANRYTSRSSRRRLAFDMRAP